METLTPDQPEFWRAHYQNHSIPWDIGQAAPPFVKLLDAKGSRLARGKMAVLGCGRGHDAALFGHHGFCVTGFDMVQEAVTEAKASYGHVARFVQANIFHLDPVYDGQFDAVLEHTCFCAISPRQRTRYVDVAERLLKPGGLFLGLFWAHREGGGPPYKTSRNEIIELFSPAFEIQSLAITPYSIPTRQGEELLGIMTFRGHFGL